MKKLKMSCALLFVAGAIIWSLCCLLLFISLRKQLHDIKTGHITTMEQAEWLVHGKEMVWVPTSGAMSRTYVGIGVENPHSFQNPHSRENSLMVFKIQNMLKKCHRNLGHPGKEAFMKLLRDAGAKPEVIKEASRFSCTECLQRGRRLSTRPSTLPKVTEKWQCLSIDTFWWHTHLRKFFNQVKSLITFLALVCWMRPRTFIVLALFVLLKKVDYRTFLVKSFANVSQRVGCRTFQLLHFCVMMKKDSCVPRMSKTGLRRLG